MNKPVLLALAMLLSLSAAADERGEAALRAEGLAIAERFVGQLKPALLAAMESGGPAHAVGVCSSVAPAIAASLSRETGWSVKRVSLKARNATARPDDWERAMLQFFDATVNAGQDPEPISAQVGPEFRVLKPQVAGPLCLACHGKKLAPAVQEALAEYYPLDRATGYQAGQVRGAISLSITASPGPNEFL